MKKPTNTRTIGVIMQRDEHLLRYQEGLRYLQQAENDGKITVHSVNTYDIGSDIVMLTNLLERLTTRVNVLIVDHALYEAVTGYLQHQLGDTSIAVLGFVIHANYTTDWFLPMCERAVEDPVLEAVQLPRHPRHERSLAQAMALLETDTTKTAAQQSA